MAKILPELVEKCVLSIRSNILALLSRRFGLDLTVIR